MNDEYLAYLLAQRAPVQRRGCMSDILTAAVWIFSIGAFALAVWRVGPDLLYSYGVPEDTIRTLFHLPAPATSAPRAPTAPTADGLNHIQSVRPVQVYNPPAPAELPDCASVHDTTTACVRSVDLAPPTATEAPAPAATDAPAYEQACVTLPNERPCWLPADQAWSPPASVPETPIVLVPPPPLVLADKCRDWRPPQVMPEECGE